MSWMDFPEPTSFNGDEDDRDGGYINRRTGSRRQPGVTTRTFPIILCDHCHTRQAFIGVSSLGVFCSQVCADEASRLHAQRMDPRRV